MRRLSSLQLATGAATQVGGLLGAAAGSLSQTANSRRAWRWARVMGGGATTAGGAIHPRPENVTGCNTSSLVASRLSRHLAGAPGEDRTETDRTGVTGQ